MRGSVGTRATARGVHIPWQPDSEARICNGCRTEFTFFRRRHHCRGCGLTFCDDCTSTRIKMPRLGHKTKVRACEPCAEMEAPPKQLTGESGRAASPSSASDSAGSSCGEQPGEASRCENCHRRGEKMRRCAECRTVTYCGRACQLEAWGLHEAVCKVARRRQRERAATEGAAGER